MSMYADLPPGVKYSVNLDLNPTVATELRLNSDALKKLQGDPLNVMLVAENSGKRKANSQDYSPDNAVDDLIKKLESRATSNPKDAIAYNHLGFLYESKGKLEKAKKAYHKVAELRPSNSTKDNIRYVDDLFENVAVPADWLYPGARTIEGEHFNKSHSSTWVYNGKRFKEEYFNENSKLKKIIKSNKSINFTKLNEFFINNIDKIAGIIFADEGLIYIGINDNLHIEGRNNVIIPADKDIVKTIKSNM